MKIRQEESTPIGDRFHDNGVQKTFDRIASAVDDFDVDTDELCDWCDCLINLTKGLKAQVKKAEIAWQKRQSQKKVMEAFNEI